MKLKVGIIQQSCTDNREENIEKSLKAIKFCASKGTELVVLQELHTDPYFCQVEDVDKFDLGDPIPGPMTDIFSNAAKQNNVVLVSSLF